MIYKIIHLVFFSVLSILDLSAQAEFDLIPYRNKSRWGYVSKDKQLKISCKYDEVGIFHNGLAWIKLNGKFAYLKKDSCLLTDIIFDSVMNFYDGQALVKVGKDEYWIDQLGQRFIPLSRGRPIETTSYGRRKITKNGKFGLAFSDTNERKLPIIYDDIKSADRELHYVKLNNKWGVVNKKNELILPIEFDEILIDENQELDIAAIRKNDLWGYVKNSTGEIIIPFKYQEANLFYGEIAKVKFHNKYGYINKQGVEYFND